MENKFSIKNFKNHFHREDKVSGRRKFLNSLWALVFGILISSIIILFTGNNPFDIFQAIFNDSTSQTVRFVTTTVVFIIATLGTAMCFKAGIFNIGISGQMMSGGITTILILKLIGINPGTILLSVFISILAGALIAFIAGFLKAFFKVNEVVSTILINWIIFYIIKFIIKSEFPGLTSSTSVSQNSTEQFVMPDFFHSTTWLVILGGLGAFMIVIMWFVFTKTTLGYKMKMLAMNKDASKYAGSNEKMMTIIIMSVAGGFAGFAGFLYYSELGQITTGLEPISMGFDTIAIALLVYNNPFGICISSILFSMIKLGCASISGKFPPLNADFAQIMFGVIIYIAAISIVFEKFKIYIYIKNQFIYRKNPNYKEISKVYNDNKLYILKTYFNNRSILNNIKKNNKKIWRKIKKDSIEQKSNLDKKMFANSKKLINLSYEDQEYYFSQINEIKKSKDNFLFENKYFEIQKIKNTTKSMNQENKSMFIKFKKEILENKKSNRKKV